MGFGVAAGVRNGLREETLLDIVLNVDQKKDKKYKGETIRVRPCQPSRPSTAYSLAFTIAVICRTAVS